MTYDDLKQKILRRIDKQKDVVLKKIEAATKCEDWQEIRDDITFIIQGYGSIMMIEQVQGASERFDEEEKPEETVELKEEEEN